MNYKLLSIAAVIGVGFACQSPTQSSGESNGTGIQQVAADDHFTASAVDAYLSLKDAMVASDAATAVERATVFESEMHALDPANEQSQVAAEAANAIANSADLEEQRGYFEVISESLYTYLKEHGNGRTLHQQFCPMAFGNRGAYWLSDEKEIRNPYFGDRMLKCGRVQETF